MKERMQLVRLVCGVAALVLGVLHASAKVQAQVALPQKAEVEQYLKQHMANVPSVTGASAAAYEVVEVESGNLGGFLRKQRIFEACVDGVGPRLEWTLLPGLTTCGYFATDGKQIWYLSGDKRKSVEALLQREGVQLERVGAKAIADLLSTLLLKSGNTSHIILSSSTDIESRAKAGSGYVIDPKERPKYQGKIQPPKITGDRQSGWDIELYTLSGWMYKKQVVSRHLFKISPRYQITNSSETLTERVFSEMPKIIY